MASLEDASKRVHQLTLDLGVAEEMRNASLASATAEAHEYATLRGRLTELEGQLSASETRKSTLEQDLESSTSRLNEAQVNISSLNVRIEELEADLDKAEGEVAKFETTSGDSAKKISDLEARLEISSKAQTKVNELQTELESIRTVRDETKQVVINLELTIKQHETEKQKQAERILEVEGISKGLYEQITELRREVSSSQQRYEELKESSVSDEESLQARLDEAQEKAAADAASRNTRIEELEALIVVIKEQCAHHTSDLEQTKALLVDAEASKTKLEESSLRVLELEGLLHEREEHASSVEHSLSEAQKQIRHHEDRHAKEVETLEQLKKDHASSVAEYEGRLLDLTTGATTNASRHAALENEVSNLTAKVTTLETDLSASQSEKESIRNELEQRVAGLEHDHKTRLADMEGQSSALQEKLTNSEGIREELQAKLADTEARLATLEQSVASGKSEASTTQTNLETSLKEALKQVASLQSELDQKTTSFEQLELRVIHNSELEGQVETLTKDRNSAVEKANSEKEALQQELVSLNAKVAESEQRLAEVCSNQTSRERNIG